MLMVVPDRGNERRDVVVVEAIAHPPPLSLGDHESELTQDPELLGDRARVHLHGRGELLDAALVVEEGEEKTDPALGREGAHRLGDLWRLARLQGAVGRAVFERMGHALDDM